MAQFTVNPTRFDPYKNFKFRVKWDGRYVAGISKCSALKRTTEVVEHREGGDPSTSRKSPGRSKFEAITLERGVTHDVEFERWANKVWNFGSGLGSEVSLKDFRKDLIIEVYNEAGQLALAYKVFRAWVSEYQALPDLDANANAVAIQHIKLENEGWERDQDVTEPTEPSFVESGLTLGSGHACTRCRMLSCSRSGSAASAAARLCALRCLPRSRREIADRDRSELLRIGERDAAILQRAARDVRVAASGLLAVSAVRAAAGVRFRSAAPCPLSDAPERTEFTVIEQCASACRPAATSSRSRQRRIVEEAARALLRRCCLEPIDRRSNAPKH